MSTTSASVSWLAATVAKPSNDPSGLTPTALRAGTCVRACASARLRSSRKPAVPASVHNGRRKASHTRSARARFDPAEPCPAGWRARSCRAHCRMLSLGRLDFIPAAFRAGWLVSMSHRRRFGRPTPPGTTNSHRRTTYTPAESRPKYGQYAKAGRRPTPFGRQPDSLLIADCWSIQVYRKRARASG
jgi:hypothetical protein